MVCMMTRSVIDNEETFDKDSNTSPVHGKIDLGMDIFIYGRNCCHFISADLPT